VNGKQRSANRYEALRFKEDNVSIKVLIIDDEVDFCYFVQKNLMRNDLFNVIYATKGKEGIKLAEQELPDIILLDLFMPDMPGEDVAIALREKESTGNIPIIYVTALVSNEDIIARGENIIGNNYVLPKPVQTKKLIKTILDVLEEFER
jgi:CheY-like chemotaxis protein